MIVKTNCNLTYTQIEKIIGLSENSIANIKCNNKKRFEKMMSYDKNELISIQKFIDHIEATLHNMGNILHMYETRSDYGRLLAKLGLSETKNLVQPYVTDSTAVFQIRLTSQDFMMVRDSSLEKWEKIIQYHKKVA